MTAAEKVLHGWKSYIQSHDPQELRALLHEDCVFFSPVVFTPQKGADATMTYLRAAAKAFSAPNFRYTHETLSERRIVLEFESEQDGTYINGTDLIDFDQDGRITRFKVMLRPLQAVNLIWQAMGEQLKKTAP